MLYRHEKPARAWPLLWGGEHEFEKHSPLGYVLRAVIQTMFVRDTYLYEPFFREGTQVSSSCCPHAADVPNLSQ